MQNQTEPNRTASRMVYTPCCGTTNENQIRFLCADCYDCFPCFMNKITIKPNTESEGVRRMEFSSNLDYITHNGRTQNTRHGYMHCCRIIYCKNCIPCRCRCGYAAIATCSCFMHPFIHIQFIANVN